MTDATISILVTVYKRIAFLKNALDSVFAQSHSKFEVLLLDDSGSSIAMEVAKEYRGDSRFLYIAHERSFGVAESLREGLQKCHCDIVAILNDDDEWEPTFLERLLEPMRDDTCVMSFCDHWIVDSDGVINMAETEKNTSTYGRDALNLGWQSDSLDLVLGKKAVPFVMGTLFRKSHLPVDEPRDAVGGGYDFWMSALLAKSGGRIHFIREPLVRYRVHDAMETAAVRQGKSQSSVAIYSDILTWNLPLRLRSEMKFRLADALFHCGKEFLAHREFRAARHHFSNAMKTKLYWKPLLGWLVTYFGDSSVRCFEWWRFFQKRLAK